MKSLVVFDSFFGNTEVVARAVAEVLETFGEARALRVAETEPKDLEGVELLVVGSPTRKFRPSPGVQVYLAKLPPARLIEVRVAAFDTRVDEAAAPAFVRFLMRRFGYAAKPIEKRLVGAGGSVAGPAEGFVVEGTQGPLREGETDRARTWARGLGPAGAAGGEAGTAR